MAALKKIDVAPNFSLDGAGLGVYNKSMNAAVTTQVLNLTAGQTITLTPAQAREIENDLDRALVAFYTGFARGKDGNGIGYAPAWELVGYLETRGLVKSIARPTCSTPLVWLTEAGHEVIEDIQLEGAFTAHVAAVRG